MQIKKIARNASSSFLMQVVNLIINMILPPMIIGVYGSKINGLVSSIKQLMSYVSLVGAGISVSTTQSLYRPLAKQDYKKINGILNAANSMFSKAGVIFSILALITSFIYPIMLKDSINYYSVMILVIVMSISGASEFFVVGKYRVLLYADQKAYVSSLVDAIGLTIGFILTFIMIKMNANIILVQLTASSVYFLRMIILSIYVKKKYNYINTKEKPIESAVANKNSAFIHQLTGLVTLSSQTIILTTFIGLEAASIYAVYNVVFSGLQSICNHTVSAVAPFLGRVKALNEYEELKIKFGKVEFIYSSILTYIYSVSSVMIIPFISIYVDSSSDINYIDYRVAYLFVIISFFNTLRLLSQSMINVSGHFKETRNRAILEASICLILQLILVQYIGIYGVLIGTAFALGWRCIDIVIYTNKYIIKQKNNRSFIRIIKTIIISIILLLINIFILPINIQNYFDWIIFGVLYSCISIILILLLNIILEKDELNYFYYKFKKFIFNKKQISNTVSDK